MKQLVIDISPSGYVTIDANGFKGAGCEKASEQIEIALGGAHADSSKKKKPDFFCAPVGSGQTIKRVF